MTGPFLMSKSSKIRWRRDLEALAKERGWDFEATNGGHLRLRKGKYVVITSSSPRNPMRSMANTLSIMRKYENEACGIQ